MHPDDVSCSPDAAHTPEKCIMRALMNLAIEPALKLYEVSALVVIDPSCKAVQRVLKVLADTPMGAISIVRDRYPRSRAHQVVSCRVLDGLAPA
jgi:hypothetical protein